MKMGKDPKHNEVTQCTKEGVPRASQLIENQADEISIAGVIDIDGMSRREYFGEVDKLTCQPRVIGKASNKT